jgi:hypothetical protein
MIWVRLVSEVLAQSSAVALAEAITRWASVGSAKATLAVT